MRSKVSVVRCGNYDAALLKEKIERALDLIGGIGKFIKGPCKVLLKPNLLSARLPEEGVNTHPEFVRAVGRLVKEVGGMVTIGDSPGSFFTIKYIDEVYGNSGMKRIAEEEGFGLARFDKIEHIDGYPIATAFKDYDLVINLPKLKTHTLAMLTGAVKNTYGFVPGLSKVQFHKEAPNIREFSKILVDIFSITKPGLSVMDGVVGMDGDGPAAGRIRNFGLVLASEDAVSLDAVFSCLAGLPYSKNAVLKAATERGEGRGRLEDIGVEGEDLESLKIKNFKLPKTELLYRFPSRFARPLAKLINFNPIINETLCKKCDICKTACPVGAITIDKDTSKINETKCVRCFCCHEVCPHDAIYIKKNFFTKIIWR